MEVAAWAFLSSPQFMQKKQHAFAKPQAEPWINDAITIGGASAVLSPIIQWGHTIMFTNGKVHRPPLFQHAVAQSSLDN